MSYPKYRLADSSDIEQLVALRIGMQREVHPEADVDGAADREFQELLRRYFERALADGTYASAVAEVEGGKLVCAAGLVQYDKPPSLTARRGRVGYVSNVFTLPEWRGRGVASDVMRALVEHARARGVERLHLGATELGLGVYERVGFKRAKYPSLELTL